MTPHTEKWKTIKGYKDRYQISNLGRVKSLITKKVISSYVTKQGRNRIKLRPANWPRLHRGKGHLIAVLVAKAFIGPKPKGKEVDHKNGIKADDRAINLQYKTRLENMQNAQRMGLCPNGERINTAKLTEIDVLWVRFWYTSGYYTRQELARDNNVSTANINCILSRKTWKHI